MPSLSLEPRVRQYLDGGDPALVLDDDALAAAAEFLDAAESLTDTPHAAAAVGLLHCLRAAERTGEPMEMLITCLFYAPVFLSRPEFVARPARLVMAKLGRKRRLRGADPATAVLHTTLRTRHPGADLWADLLTLLSVLLTGEGTGRADPGALAEASAVLRHAIVVTPAGSPGRPRRYSALGTLLQRRYQLFHDDAQLRDSIEAHEQATADASHPDYPSFLFGKSTALLARFRESEDETHLRAALRTAREGLAATSPNQSDHPARQGHLGLCLLASHQLTGSEADLREGLRCLRLAMSLDDDDSGRAFLGWNALGSGLHALYQRTGDVSALMDGLTTLKRVLGVEEPSQVRTKRESLVAISYGGFLLRRYEHDQEPQILDDALSWLLAAKRADRQGDRERLPPQGFVALCANLGVAWLEQYRRYRELSDLAEAEEQAQRALRTAQPGSDDEAAVRGILAQVHAARHEFNEFVASLEPDRPADAENLIEQMRAAAGATRPERADYSTRMANLGLALRQAGGGDTSAPALADAREAFSMAAGSEAGPPKVRIEAAMAAARLAADNRLWDKAAQQFSQAIGLLERAVPASLARTDREYQLQRLHDLAADAAACALNCGDVSRAAELLERGRGVLLAQELYLRSDLPDTAELPAELRQRFDRLRAQVERFGNQPPAQPQQAQTGDAVDATAPTAGEERLNVYRQWEETLTEIRQIKDLDRFMTTPTSGELTAAAEQGPVVLLSTSEYGSAALVVRTDGIEPVRLPDLNPQVTRTMVAELLTLQDEDGRRRQDRLTDLLGWLWDAIAMPIMNSDAIAGHTRLWWCPSGLLSFLPLHAAGHHQPARDGNPLTVLDRVISSYIPTVRALTRARSGGLASHQLQVGKGQAIAVVMPETPGQTGLPAAKAEAKAFGQNFSPAVILTGQQATREAVLRALPDVRLAHFACHGTANLTSPSQSCLHLADDPLPVTDILRLRLRHGELAFLSACSTAQPGTRLADEAIHLVSAFQLAGFRHVIGTLWPVTDRSTAAISADLYATVKKSRATVAGALHAVTRKQRDLHPDLPGRWAAHIHSGG